MERDQATKFIYDLLRLMVSKKASDLFITAGFPPAIKIDGKISPVSKTPLSPQHTIELVRSVMNDKQAAEFEATKECNFAIAPPGIGRFRVSAFVQMGLTGAVLRTIAGLEPVSPGSLGADGYKRAVADLVNFLVYLGEPVKLQRHAIGGRSVDGTPGCMRCRCARDLDRTCRGS